MVVWRRWIFPILMVLAVGAIAAALVKIAFLSEPEATNVAPQTTMTDPVVTAAVGSVTSELTLPGTITRDADVTVRSDGDGVITEVHVASGADVVAGQAIFTVKQADPWRVWDIVAPEAGTLGEMAMLKGQSVTLGGEIVKLTPDRFHLVSTVESTQLYRLLNAPSEGSVTVNGGPAPFTCTSVRVDVADGSSATVQCDVPVDQMVFSGLPATVAISIGHVENAVVIPTTAVKGGAGTGLVWIDRGEGAEAEERSISLGLSDGTTVQVLEGLAEGESIRQFVPGALAEVEENCWDDGRGGTYCEPGSNW